MDKVVLPWWTLDSVITDVLFFLQGCSQIKPTFDSAFRKNAAFSKPIEEYWDQPKPFENELAPNM